MAYFDELYDINEVIFDRQHSRNFALGAEADINTIYFIQDTHEIIMGRRIYGGSGNGGMMISGGGVFSKSHLISAPGETPIYGYNRGNVVYHMGSLYLCVNDISSADALNQNPDENTTDWELLSPSDYSYITYNELVILRNNNQLIPGGIYRITDYQTIVTTTTPQTTINGSYIQSAGHQFDIIVTALSSNKLDENARVIHHDGDTYFTDNDLNAWEIKYCLDNDTNKFTWANNSTGKGVIYYMKDEFNNECPYDFKNIMFKRFLPAAIRKSTNNNWPGNKNSFFNNDTQFAEEGRVFFITGLYLNLFTNPVICDFVYKFLDSGIFVESTYKEYQIQNGVTTDITSNIFELLQPAQGIPSTHTPDTDASVTYDEQYNIVADTRQSIYLYTFSGQNGSDIIDLSLTPQCNNNTIKPYRVNSSTGLNERKILRLSNNIIYIKGENFDNLGYNRVSNNKFDVDCINNTICTIYDGDYDIIDNVFEYECHDNIILGNYSYHNTIKHGAGNNIMTSNGNCDNNTIGYSCTGNYIEGSYCIIDDWSNKNIIYRSKYTNIGCNCHENVVYGSNHDSEDECTNITFKNSSMCGVGMFAHDILFDNVTRVSILNTNEQADEDHKICHISVIDGYKNHIIQHSSVNAGFRTIYGKQKIIDDIKITYDEIVNLIQNHQLIPGNKYRITDYQTITKQVDTISALHQFDIVVTAVSTNQLAENAHVVLHRGPLSTETSLHVSDSYFQYEKLSSWEIKYHIFNDEERFVWAYNNWLILNLPTAGGMQNPKADIGILTRHPELDNGFTPSQNGVNGTPISTLNNYQYCWLDKNGDKYWANNDDFEFETSLSNDDLSIFKLAYEYDSSIYDIGGFNNKNFHKGGYGVIYYMKDENGNECPYDFKNILFRRYSFCDTLYNTSQLSNLLKTYFDLGELDWSIVVNGQTHIKPWAENNVDFNIETPQGRNSLTNHIKNNFNGLMDYIAAAQLYQHYVLAPANKYSNSAILYIQELCDNVNVYKHFMVPLSSNYKYLYTFNLLNDGLNIDASLFRNKLEGIFDVSKCIGNVIKPCVLLIDSMNDANKQILNNNIISITNHDEIGYSHNIFGYNCHDNFIQDSKNILIGEECSYILIDACENCRIGNNCLHIVLEGDQHLSIGNNCGNSGPIIIAASMYSAIDCNCHNIFMSETNNCSIGNECQEILLLLSGYLQLGDWSTNLHVIDSVYIKGDVNLHSSYIDGCKTVNIHSSCSGLYLKNNDNLEINPDCERILLRANEDEYNFGIKIGNHCNNIRLNGNMLDFKIGDYCESIDIDPGYEHCEIQSNNKYLTINKTTTSSSSNTAQNIIIEQSYNTEEPETGGIESGFGYLLPLIITSEVVNSDNLTIYRKQAPTILAH